jgi:hypothetical protein
MPRVVPCDSDTDEMFAGYRRQQVGVKLNHLSRAAAGLLPAIT